MQAQIAAQLQALAGLERTVTTGNATAIAAVRGEIAGAIAVSATVSQQARDSGAQRADLAAASGASRQQVQSLMRDMHRFDPCLRFASADDETEYRRREAERRAYVEQQQARGTPEGNLNAAAGAVGQMVDADAHGAGNSPEFRQRWNDLVATTQRLREEVQRSGGSTREFDDRLRGELRATLRSRGLSNAEIDARLAAHGDNPLDAVRDVMHDSDDVRMIDRSVAQIWRRASISPVALEAAPPPTDDRRVDDAIVALRLAGVTAAPQPAGEGFAHGVTANERTGPASGPSGPG